MAAVSPPAPLLHESTLFPCIHIIASAVALLVLPSCQTMTGGSGAAVAALPEAWRNAADFPQARPERDLATWWGRFDDPVLPKVITAALEGSPDLASAAARV
jgi:outer membrane protein TolC